MAAKYLKLEKRLENGKERIMRKQCATLETVIVSNEAIENKDYSNHSPSSSRQKCRDCAEDSDHSRVENI